MTNDTEIPMIFEDDMEDDNVIVFPFFQRINADELSTERVTEHYLEQLMKLFRYHGFEIENEKMINDMTVISMLLNAALKRNIGKSDNFQITLDKITQHVIASMEVAEED